MNNSERKFGPWKIWNGGRCPVDGDMLVHVQYRHQSRRDSEKNMAMGKPLDFSGWSHFDSDRDIIAYREFIQPVIEEFTIRQFAKAYGLSAAMLAENKVCEDFVPGITTVATVDGKPTKIVWVADQ